MKSPARTPIEKRGRVPDVFNLRIAGRSGARIKALCFAAGPSQDRFPRRFLLGKAGDLFAERPATRHGIISKSGVTPVSSA